MLNKKFNFNKVLFYQPWGMGDMVMFTPVILNFKKRYPNAKLDLLCRRCSYVLMKNSGIIDNFLISPERGQRTFKNSVALIAKIRKGKYDLILPAAGITNHYMGNIIVQVSAAKYKAGNISGKFLWDRLDFSCHRDINLHRVEQNIQILEAIFGQDQKFSFDFYRPAKKLDVDNAAAFLCSRGFNDGCILGVHAGCDKANSYKRWPNEKFRSLLTRFLKENLDARIIAFIGPGEEDLHLAYPKDEFPERVIQIDNQPINKVAAFLGLCRLVLTTDSGLGHIARAMDTPTLAIMGPGRWDMVKPYSSDGYFIKLKPSLECMPCVGSVKICDSQPVPCLAKLSVGAVYEKLSCLWQKYSAISFD